MSYQAALDRLAEEDDVFGFSIEVAYLLDMTGSMGSWMRTSAQQLIAITQEVKQRMHRECGSAALVRFALIGYRDHCDGNRRFVRFPANQGFSSKIEDVCNAISKAQACGGGDLPEDVEGAMRLACALPWSADVRFCLLLTDAPCHGRTFHDQHDDHPNDPSPVPRLLELREQKVQMVMCPLTSLTDRMTAAFRQAYDANNMNKLITIDMKDQNTGLFNPRISARLILKLMGV
jgi:hypothetical protein